MLRAAAVLPYRGEVPTTHPFYTLYNDINQRLDETGANEEGRDVIMRKRALLAKEMREEWTKLWGELWKSNPEAVRDDPCLLACGDLLWVLSLVGGNERPKRLLQLDISAERRSEYDAECARLTGLARAALDVA
ncbi:hypothetical protein LZC95_19585 [Pendulispora brunnea]|uniref:Uncharacterized protein n=1 Tax=Pendulispora brunnea TaxID=2905690 RepID=A0ABZ2KN41_9BACT